MALTCLTADSSSIHTLSPTDGIITTYFLPLTDNIPPPSKGQHDSSETYEPTSENESRIHRVVSKLPSHIIQSFRLDPPLELICVDNFLIEGRMKEVNGKGRLPLLCAYNGRAAFVLDISYSSNTWTDDESSSNHPREAQGYVDEIMEPFETHLLSSKLASSPKILRIRSAPQSVYLGGGVYETLNPRAAMVMLTDEHSLVVHHGISEISITPTTRLSNGGGYISIPFSIRMEDVEGGDPLVDFSFVPSSPKGMISVFNAMTVVLTTRSGCLYLVSPILFHGTVLPTKDIHACMSHLEQELAQVQIDHPLVNTIEGATWRRNRAALQFLVDAFGSSPATTQTHPNNYYLTAKIFEGGARCGTAWPVSIQGPLCSREIYNEPKKQQDVPCRVSCMEVTTSTMSMGTLSNAILSGHRNLQYKSSIHGRYEEKHSDDFVNFVVFPSATYPRFAFESKTDGDMLNHLMHHSTVIADKIYIDTEDEHNDNNEATENEFAIVTNDYLSNGRDISIVVDPVNKNIIHHVSRYGVYTIKSNAFEITGQKILSIMNEKKVEPLHHADIKVSAFPSIEVVSNKNGDCVNGKLSGAVVIGDAQYGHLLVVTLEGGPSRIAILNLSVAQYLHENQIEKSESVASDDILTTMESISPLHEIIAPLFEKITVALTNMSKIVGGSTSPKDISAGGVALFLERKENSGKNIVSPLIELSGLIKARVKFLQDMRAHQEQQLSQLSDKIEALKRHAKSQYDVVKAAEMTSDMLINRSAKVLSAMRNRAPAVTHSEREYFDQIRRYDVQSSKWTSMLEQMDSMSMALQERIDDSPYQLKLSLEQRTACVDLLNGQKVLLERNASELQKCGQSIRGLLTESGIA